MIVYWLLKIVYWLIYALFYVILILPDVSIPVEFHDNIQTGYSYALAINSFVPVVELVGSIAVIYLAYEGYHLLLQVINWIIRKIPSIN